MKFAKYILAIGIVGLAMTSCEDWLDENPKYTLDNSVIFENQEYAKQALDACYGYLTTTNAFGQCLYEISVGASGLSWAQTNASEQDRFASLNAMTSGDVVTFSWNGLYKTIQECNTFIVNMENGTLSDELKANYTAQASFIRGLCYYYLAMMWGDVPLRTSPSSHDAVATSKSSFADVIDRVFIDWKYAYDNLPVNGEHVDGYIDKTGVAAYLAKLNWILSCNPDLEAAQKQAYLNDAKIWCDLVYGRYTLQSRYADLFVNHVKGSKESIFQLNFTTASDAAFNRLNWVFAADNYSKGVAYQRVRATKSFHDLFRGTYPGDPRYDATFLTRWYNAKGGSSYHYVSDSVYTYPYKTYKTKNTSRVVDAVACIPYDQLADPTNPTIDELTVLQEQFYTENESTGERVPVDLVRQFATSVGDHQGWPLWKKQADMNCESQHSNNNIIMYRYADFLLLMADVYNELDQTSTAIGYVNEVLRRARTSVSPAAAQPADYPTSLTKDQLRDKIFYERLFELAGEPDMYIEVRRGGIASLKKVLEIANRHEITYEHCDGEAQKNNPDQRFRDRYFGEDAYFYDKVSDENFLKKNLHLPIPHSELSANDGLTVADQNFGY